MGGPTGLAAETVRDGRPAGKPRRQSGTSLSLSRSRAILRLRAAKVNRVFVSAPRLPAQRAARNSGVLSPPIRIRLLAAVSWRSRTWGQSQRKLAAVVAATGSNADETGPTRERTAEMAASHDDDDAEVAEQEAASILGEEWEFELPDPERFRLPGAVVDTYTVAAHRDGKDAALVVAIGKANAFRQLIRRVHGDLQPAESWAPPLPLLGEPEPDHFIGPYDDKDPEVEAALRDVVAALPEGWQMYDVDRERFRVAGRKIEVFAVSAVGAGGDGALVLAIGEATAYRHLARRVRGELETTEAWAPLLDFEA